MAMSIRNLFGSYFHEEWGIEYQNSWKEAVVDYLKTSGIVELSSTYDSILSLLARADIQELHDEGIAELLDQEFHLCVDPREAGMSYRNWLRSIADLLKEKIEIEKGSGKT